jgi:transcriptional regulator with XRE-family HTH domain
VRRPAERNRFAEWFRDERERAGLTQTQLGRRLKLRQAYISNIENGQRRLDILEFLDLAAALGEAPRTLLSRLEAQIRRSTE